MASPKKRKHHGKRNGLDALRKRLTLLQIAKRGQKIARRAEEQHLETA